MKKCYVPKRFGKAALAKIATANAIMEEYIEAGFDLSLRQVYYQHVARDLIPNTEKSYKALGALISDARLAGLIDWHFIQDRTRNLKSLPHWDNPSELVQACAEQFHVDYWADQDNRVEIWVEKDALVGIVQKACDPLDVPYFSCRGYTSQSEMWAAGRRLKRHIDNGYHPIIFHLGDHDPSGIDMSRDIQDRLSLFAEQQIDVFRIALTMSQVDEYDPPPNPAKVTDSRFTEYQNTYGDDSWELDALEPNVLVELITSSINEYRDVQLWAEKEAEEAAGRNNLQTIADTYDDIVENL